MKPVFLAIWVAAGALAVLTLGCDDDGPTMMVEPEPDPEPDASTMSWVVTETRTFAADGALLFSDAYQYDAGQLRGIVRSHADGATAAIWAMTHADDGMLDRVDVGLGMTTFFALEGIAYGTDGLIGFFTKDAEGATVSSHVVEYDAAGARQKTRVADGSRVLYIDAYDAREGVLSRITRLGPQQELLASITVEATEGVISHISAVTPDGPAEMVEVDSEQIDGAPPLDPVLLVHFGLTTTEGVTLPVSRE